MSEQLPLLPATPAPVSRPLAVYRRARRLLRTFARLGQPIAFDSARQAEDFALLEDLRRQYQSALRTCKRSARQAGSNSRGGRAAARFAASPEGRRYFRAIDRVSERVQSWENALCG